MFVAVPTTDYEQPPRYGEEVTATDSIFADMLKEETASDSFLKKTRTEVKIHCRRYA